MRYYFLFLEIFIYLIPDVFLMMVIHLMTGLIPIRRKKYSVLDLGSARSADDYEAQLNNFRDLIGRPADLVTIIESPKQKGELLGVFKCRLN